MPSSYKKLEKIFKQLNILNSIQSLINWDIEVMMPPAALKMHVDKLQLLANYEFEIIKNPKLINIIDDAKKENLDNWQKSNLYLIEKDYKLKKAIPDKLEKEFIKSYTHCNAVWRDAKPRDDFKSFASAFAPMLELVIEIADIRASVLNLSRYDSLLDAYDPGRKSCDIDGLFDYIEKPISELIKKRVKSQDEKPSIAGFYPEENQKALGEECMRDLDFDFTRGRLDISTHPFCTGALNDIRITTRYKTDEFISSIMGVLHETGHALYEMNLPKKWAKQPVGASLGMAVHESQSHFVEMQLTQTKEFVSYLKRKIDKHFPDYKNTLTEDCIFKNITYVQPSLIRVDADELTYPMHIILRYKIEKMLINRSLKASDLPDAWNEGMIELLGVKPNSNKDGCMQDVHWPSGSFGYFPSYTLGSMIAAQLAYNCRKDISNYNELISKGEFSNIFSWLKDKIHKHGSLHLSSDNLLLDSTGEALNPEYYLSYLKNKYI